MKNYCRAGSRLAQNILLAAQLLTAAAVLVPVYSSAATQYAPSDYKSAGQKCMMQRELDCAEKNWASYVKLRPTDSKGIAMLGIILNQRDKHEAAIVQFEKAIDLGEGTYDLFSYYADSLAKSGRVNDAIDWSYKALVVVPTLVDVRGNLAKLLVLQKRHYEALSLLAAFDDNLASTGHPPYFEGQRIAIESAAQRAGQTQSPEQIELKLPKIGGHFFSPVTIGEARPIMFMVDTGASKTSMSEEFLAQSKAAYKVTRSAVGMTTADGHMVKARLVNIESLKVAGFELKNVSTIVCKGCVSLLGQATLSQFDMKSSRVQGVEFLSLTRRKAV